VRQWLLVGMVPFFVILAVAATRGTSIGVVPNPADIQVIYLAFFL